MYRWLWLVGISIAMGAVVPILAAMAMIAKGGSHVDYCPNLPAEYWIPCMPSMEGIGLAAMMTVMFAVPVFVIGAIVLIYSGQRSKR